MGSHGAVRDRRDDLTQLFRPHIPHSIHTGDVGSGVFSCHVKLIKPDPAIYAKLCETCDIKPEESLFVDDNAANIESAKAFGLHAIRFEGYEKSYEVVMEYLEKYS